MKDGCFDSDQNKEITWAHMLQLTSEWEGTLWDKPDWIDHYRDVMGDTTHAEKRGSKRTLQPPGTYWEYNDVRVNQLSFALMRTFGRSLPEVLQERIMGPIGATKTWGWHGYQNSWSELNGKKYNQYLEALTGVVAFGLVLWITPLSVN